MRARAQAGHQLVMYTTTGTFFIAASTAARVGASIVRVPAAGDTQPASASTTEIAKRERIFVSLRDRITEGEPELAAPPLVRNATAPRAPMGVGLTPS